MGVGAPASRRAAAEAAFGSAAHKADPHPFYARLRAESPVHRVTLPDGRAAWLVVRYDDAAALLRDERFAKDRSNALAPGEDGDAPWMPAMVRPLTRNMLDLDVPDHTRLRALVHKAFTPRLVERLGGRIETLTAELLDTARRRRRMDLIRHYALPVPTTIIAEMLGVPGEDRPRVHPGGRAPTTNRPAWGGGPAPPRHRFHRWSRAIVAADWGKLAMARAIPAIWLFLRYLRRLIARRRGEPGDDLLSALVEAEEAGDRLSEDELVAMAFLLLVAGHETTVNLIGNGTLALLQNRDQMERLREDPGLLPSAIEELLRFASPLELATERFARQDLTVAGVEIPRGGLVFAALASANRDERQFPDPERLDLAREPNRHLAFGLGIHYCLGAPLARLEGRIAIATLLRRAPGLRLAADAAKLRWRRGLVLRGLEALPVELGARARGGG